MAARKKKLNNMEVIKMKLNHHKYKQNLYLFMLFCILFTGVVF